ncbi:hypothetical protein [Hymenobacter chitinivorans]|uniref:SdpC family antimicrobial peptide n=1 Tax=Hymenobacter chitinivorans DSM 11115 TaxID=1121954 RepID=A0A2M9AQT9_9BACT|nr:hypothetical protein [Hymenobacter chitinivorans]PJJ48052.1 SdpC family antimicrobial peptide [Hymenobacter chitinivorans DSM 11115]
MITKVRETVSNLRFIAPVAAHFLLVSCNSDVVAPKGAPRTETSTKAATSVSFSGEDLFRGIFLFQGPVAERLPILAETLHAYGANSEADGNEEAKEFSNEMVQSVNKLDETYFARLKKAVDSKDPFIVHSALEEGMVLFQKAGQASEKYGPTFAAAAKAYESLDLSKYDTTTPEGREQLSTDIKNNMGDQLRRPSWLYIETAVVAVVAIGVYILVVFVIVARQDKNLWGDGLESEQFVAQIIENLAS